MKLLVNQPTTQTIGPLQRCYDVHHLSEKQFNISG